MTPHPISFPNARSVVSFSLEKHLGGFQAAITPSSVEPRTSRRSTPPFPISAFSRNHKIRNQWSAISCLGNQPKKRQSAVTQNPLDHPNLVGNQPHKDSSGLNDPPFITHLILQRGRQSAEKFSIPPPVQLLCDVY